MARPIGSRNLPKSKKLSELLSRPFKDPENAIERLINFQIEKQVWILQELFDDRNFKQFDLCQRTLLELARFTNDVQLSKKGKNQKLDLDDFMEKLGIKEDLEPYLEPEV
jgi:HEAT repeat protein